jgi:hypothetical protein
VPGYQKMTYYVDPTTYRPIELDKYGSSSKDLTRLVFHVYQQLPTKRNAWLPIDKLDQVDVVFGVAEETG